MARRRRKLSRVKSLRDLDFEPDFELSGETKRWIFIIVVFTLALLSLLSLLNAAGTLGVYFNTMLEFGFGVIRWFVPILLLIVGYFLLRPVKYGFRTINGVGLALLVFGVTGLLHIIFHHEDVVAAARLGQGGGYLGLVVSWTSLKLMDFWASLIVSIAVTIIGTLLFFEVYLLAVLQQQQARRQEAHDAQTAGLLKRLSQFFDQRRIQKAQAARERLETSGDAYDKEPDFIHHRVDVEQYGGMEPADVKSDGTVPEEDTSAEEEENFTDGETLSASVKKYQKIKVDLPLSLLDGKTTAPRGGDLKANQLIIQKTLRNFGIEAEMGEARVGPTVTQYTLKPAEGVRLSRITALSDNLALTLAAHPIRIEAPIPGKSLVGIEVPNEAKSSVPLNEILSSVEFTKRRGSLAVALGKDVMGKAWLYPLDQMPHLLIAGATGSGKSVAINTLILSLLYQNDPADLRFIMVDPKRVELPVYNGIPNLLTPVITDTKKTINALRWTIKEMERRFDELSRSGHRNIQSYNESNEEHLPYIVFVIDELADLMASSGAEVEAAIVRLAQMSRAVGIHLVLATQRPSVDVITGLIKANIPARLAFSVASLVDSRTILDMAGAEKLLGRGDMLFITSEFGKPKRLQGAFASDIEIKRVIDHLKKQADTAYIDEVTEKQQAPSGFSSAGEGDESDPLLPEAREVIIRARKASASLLQRRLRVGYARAARILDLLEEQGVIGPGEGAKPREVLIAHSGDGTIDHTGTESFEEYEENIDREGDYEQDDIR